MPNERSKGHLEIKYVKIKKLKRMDNGYIVNYE